jgi:hypothetical protein
MGEEGENSTDIYVCELEVEDDSRAPARSLCLGRSAWLGQAGRPSSFFFLFFFLLFFYFFRNF